MKERPILFKGEMVRAILYGRKTQTRRILGNKKVWPSDIIQDTDWIDGKEVSLGFESDDHGWLNTEIMCPYGQPGDRLWVRETHARVPGNFMALPHYLADGPIPTISQRHDAGLLRTYPSIHMPRWASRITLEITGVRVERLQDISEEDAKAEGLRWHNLYREWGGVEVHPDSRPELPQWRWYENPIEAFKNLWESINGADSWNANPWVWVVEFKRLERTQQEQAA